MKKIVLLLLIIISVCSNSEAQKMAEVIKGTWVTNVASNILKSKRNIKEGIKLCKKNGINNIYVVVWNQGVTMFPSKVVEEYIGVKQSKIYGNRDPIKEIIEEGHKEGIKVHAWFEFGFSYNYGDSNCLWQKRYPDWVGRDVKGNLLQKNKFFWWNSLNPDVQKFMTKLVVEVVKKYNVDGVQGDDRLPAMPSEGGYDPFTKKLYAAENNGAEPPSDSKDSSWVQWRANKLSTFCKSLYKSVKKVKPTCIVSWAPSIYPWCKEQYLQDWPKWLEGGYADYVIPQLYRYKISDYERILKELNTQVEKKYKGKVFPGILSSLGDGYLSSPELNAQMIALNRKYGFKGEVFFYFETLKRMKENFYKKS